MRTLTLTPATVQFEVFAMVYTPALIGFDQIRGEQGAVPPNQPSKVTLRAPITTTLNDLLAVQYVRANRVDSVSPPFVVDSTVCNDIWADARLTSPTDVLAPFSATGVNYVVEVATFTTTLSLVPFPAGLTNGTLPGSFVISAGQTVSGTVG